STGAAENNIDIIQTVRSRTRTDAVLNKTCVTSIRFLILGTQSRSANNNRSAVGWRDKGRPPRAGERICENDHICVTTESGVISICTYREIAGICVSCEKNIRSIVANPIESFPVIIPTDGTGIDKS